MQKVVVKSTYSRRTLKSMTVRAERTDEEKTTRVARSKDGRLSARVTSETKALFVRAAEIQGRSVTDFMVQSTVEAAQRVIREYEYLDLSQRDRVAFVEAVLNPLPPGDRLMEAARRHQHLPGDR